MSDKLISVNYEDDELTVALEISRATALMGMRRHRMIFDAAETIKKKADQPETPLDEAMETMRLVVFPDYMSCVTKWEAWPAGRLVWPISFEQFIALPEQLVNRWGIAVYKANPHWSTLGEEVADTEKKDSTLKTMSSPIVENPPMKKSRRHRSSLPSPGV